MDECKSIMYNNFSQSNEKLTSLLQQNNSHLIDKTTILLNEILPKNSDNIQKNTKLRNEKRIKEKEFKKTIQKEIKIAKSALKMLTKKAEEDIKKKEAEKKAKKSKKTKKVA